MRRLTFSLLILFTLLVFMPVGVQAQDDTAFPVIVGDVESESLEVVQTYMVTQDRDLLADDVTFVSEILFEPVVGRDALLRSPTILFGDAFTDVVISPRQYIVAEDTVVVEFDFTGVNTGTYRSLPPTDIAAYVLMVGIYTVADGQITNIRQYYDSSDLQAQLGYPPYTGVRPVPLQILEPDQVDDIVDNPDAFYDTDVSVQGSYGEPVGQHGFTFWDEDFIDIGQEGLLVLDASGQGLDFTPVEGTTLTVSGTVREFDRAALEADLGYALTAQALENYENFTVLLADSATNLDDVETLGNIEAAPSAFYGQVVTVEGRIGEAVGANAFVLYEDQLIGVGGEVMAFSTAIDPMVSANERVQVTGIVRPLVIDFIETEIDQELTNDMFDDYDLPALIVQEMTVLE